MNDTMNNTHVAMAKFRQEGVHEWQAEEGSTDATNLAATLDAQVEATLALAYEQRTANLIALYADANNGAVTSGVDYGKLADQIKERLGLA